MFTVFFSHGTADYHIAESFKRELEQMKMAVYLFEHDRQPGYDIASKLQNAIERADIVVVLLATFGAEWPFYLAENEAAPQGASCNLPESRCQHMRQKRRGGFRCHSR